MRSEKEMFNLILGYARNDSRIKAVYLNGSRANPNAVKDKYQDYDIVYVVTETTSFLSDKKWLSEFGDIAMIQEPDSNDFGWGVTADLTRRYTWLILFKDGNRIDLTISTLEDTLESYTTDKLNLLLLDKESCLPEISYPSDIDYLIKKPAERQYNGCCNEFWWCLNNVAKGIARDELPYAMEMYNHYVRDMLNRMTEWYIGINNDFSVSAGKMGKYYKKYLSQEFYDLYTKTYSDCDYEKFWNAIFNMCNLFRILAIDVALAFNFTYNKNDDINITEYLKKVKNDEY